MSDPIVDEDKVQEMSAALAEGRRVRFSPDGQSSASLDAGNPIQQPAADFISTKLDEINDLLGRGFEVAVDPDGSVFAYNADRTGRYLLDVAGQVKSDHISFLLADAGSPTIVKDPGDDQALYVLMPMRV